MTLLMAKPTLYKDIRFRSRLEARWAIFLDALGGQWVYEPVVQGVTGYLPDFLFGGGYLEIKPASWVARDKDKKEADIARWLTFAMDANARLDVCFGAPGEWINGRLAARSGLGHVLTLLPEPDSQKSQWVECRSCGSIRIAAINEPICLSCPPWGPQFLHAIDVVRDHSYADAP